MSEKDNTHHVFQDPQTSVDPRGSSYIDSALAQVLRQEIAQLRDELAQLVATLTADGLLKGGK
jgi:hypothetical protein